MGWWRLKTQIFWPFSEIFVNFSKVLAILCKTRNVLSRRKTNHTKWRHYIHITTKNHKKKEFSQYTDSWRKRRLFFSIIFISVLCDNTWGHTYFVETRKIVQIKIKSDEHDNPISLNTKYLAIELSCFCSKKCCFLIGHLFKNGFIFLKKYLIKGNSLTQ